MLVRNSIMFHRQNDASNEYREVILYEDAGAPRRWAVWECVSFLSGPETTRRSERAHGGEHDMKNFFQTVVEGLRKEGFVVCLPENIPPR
jgi:hypothetical protein